MPRTWLAKLAAVGILTGCLIGIMRLTAPETKTPIPELQGARDFLAPAQRVLTGFGGTVAGGIRELLSWGNARELETMASRINELESELIIQKELELENIRLRRLLAYEEDNQATHLVVAKVVGRDPDNWFGVLHLDRGENDGLANDLPVIAPEGLVGRTMNVTPETCEVLLITDPRSGVGAMIQETRTAGVIKGVLAQSTTLTMSYLSKDVNAAPGQSVITSGLGQVFPQGIPVGRIVSTKRDPTGLTQSAEVSSLVDLDRLEEVMVITALPAGG